MGLVAVPGRGASIGWDAIAGSIVFRRLGPFGPGCYLERLELWLSSLALHSLFFSASFGISSAQTAEGFQTGVSLIRSEDAILDGRGAVLLVGAAGGVSRISVPIGVRVVSSPMYVIARMEHNSGVNSIFGLLSLTVVALVEDVGGVSEGVAEGRV